MRNSKKKLVNFTILSGMILLMIAQINVTDTAIVNAAKKKSSNKTVVVDNAKKGTKITSGSYVYKITRLSKKESTVTIVGVTKKAKKKLNKVKIPDNIKIKSKKGKNKGTYSYKVTAVKAKAFKGCSKITSVTIGDNVTSIGKHAFENCTKLKKVSLGRNVKVIDDYAFAGDKNLVSFIIPKNSELETLKKYVFKGCTKLKNINFENATKLKNIDDTTFKDTQVDTEEVEKIVKDNQDKYDVTKYSYEIIPLLEPFNEYFLIKTDNPNPESFRFWDAETVYDIVGKSGGYKRSGDTDWTYYPNELTIKPVTTVFADVVYENEETARVKGGYIGSSSFTDGGKVTLQARVETVNEYGRKSYEFKDTDVTIDLPVLVDSMTYLINTYGKDKTEFFDKMTAIENGLYSICLYSGAAVRGELNKDEKNPYYGLSTSPHVDQDFYIQNPYYRTNSVPMLVSSLYPYRYDSIGFPSAMSSIAKMLAPSADVKWSSTAHYMVDVTYGGVTKSYGGAGSGGGQAITKDMITYRYKFDGSADDAATKISLSDISSMLCNYGKMTVPDDIPAEGRITWSDVNSAVGEGSYVRLLVINSIFGGGGTGFTYLYNNGTTGSVGYFSNAWYDGRYFNSHEYFSKGVKFADADKAAIIVKDAVIKYPDDGKDYRYIYSKLSDIENYNSETGVWSGYTRFNYDSESGNWIANVYSSSSYYDKETWKYNKIDDQDFIDACTLTPDEVAAMDIDRNADVDPESFLIYDMQTAPGTKN